jgi:hypothetical protein
MRGRPRLHVAVVGDADEEAGGLGGGGAGAAALFEVAGVGVVGGGVGFFFAVVVEGLVEGEGDAAEHGGGGGSDLAGDEVFEGGHSVLDVWARGPEGEGGHGEAVVLGDFSHGVRCVGETFDDGVFLGGGEGGGEVGDGGFDDGEW